MDQYIINTQNFQLTHSDFLMRALVALGIGFIIGLEREHAAMQEKVKGFAGIRTFIFVVLLGFMAGMAHFLLSPIVYAGLLLTVIMLTGISYYITASKGDIGTTTEFSILIAFLLGSFAFLGMLEISLMIMVLVVVLLSAKVKLQSIVGAITVDELYDFIRFVVVALLVFPFLPNRAFDTFGVLNPREIGWVILLTSGLGFVGYMLMKFLGPNKGILISGLVGGLISSTALTWVFAKKSKVNEHYERHYAMAILAASSVMMLRVLIWTFVFNQNLFHTVYLYLLILFASTLGVTLFFLFQSKPSPLQEGSIRQGKPLDLQGALVFGLIYTVILLIVSYANAYMGDKGLLISSALAGLSDIDAITITVAKLALDGLDLTTACNALLIATLANTLVKLGIGIWAGSAALRRYLYIGYGVVIITALLLMVLFNS